MWNSQHTVTHTQPGSHRAYGQHRSRPHTTHTHNPNLNPNSRPDKQTKRNNPRNKRHPKAKHTPKHTQPTHTGHTHARVASVHDGDTITHSHYKRNTQLTHGNICNQQTRIAKIHNNTHSSTTSRTPIQSQPNTTHTNDSHR